MLKRYCVPLDPDIHIARVDQIAADEQVSRASVLRRLLTNALREHEYQRLNQDTHEHHEDHG
jgi:hypothetical protein